MADTASQQDQFLRQQTIDPAALAGAATAAALAVFLQAGPFYPLNGCFGISLLAILLTYELKRYRTRWQSVAFGAVCALCALLVVGFVTEYWKGGWNSNYWVELEKNKESLVSQWELFFWWLALTVVFTGLGVVFAISPPQSSK
jgi:hypothetical protein